MKEYKGNSSKNEIEIVNDEESIKKILNQLNSKSKSKLGTVYEDDYILVVRDPVRFPNNRLGTYLRVIERPALDGVTGAVIIPFYKNKFILRKFFRHVTRSWEIEFPRGYREKGESPYDCAKRELNEELGIKIDSINKIGTFYSNTGILAGNIDVFFAQLKNTKINTKPNDEEALGEVIALSYSALMEQIKEGNIRDGISLAALQLALATNLIQT